METLKLGSKGDSVKQLQKALNLTADGDFGPKTDQAVKTFQKNHNLTVDGVVGPKTWELILGNQTTSGIQIIHKPLSAHVTKLPNRPIKYLAIHFTAGSNSKPGKALTMYNTFMTRSASADFGVDDRDIVQFNPDIKNYYCWAVGDKKNPYSKGGTLNAKANNKNTISIEICSTCTPANSTTVSKANHSGWSFTDAALDNALKLSKMLMQKYNIPIENVVRHYDITGKLCPGIIGWNNESIYTPNGEKTSKFSTSVEWEKFKSKLK